MKRFLLSVVLSQATICLYAQNHSKGIHYHIQIQELYSTHSTPFYGAAFSAGRQLNKNILLGVGTEYSFASVHPDNEFSLSKLRFVPVFFDLNWFPWSNKKIQPYFHTSHGASFNSYRRVHDDQVANVRELGYYAYAAPGLRINSTSKHIVSLEVGLKGFKMSANNLDINPHGITGRLGYSF